MHLIDSSWWNLRSLSLRRPMAAMRWSRSEEDLRAALFEKLKSGDDDDDQLQLFGFSIIGGLIRLKSHHDSLEYSNSPPIPIRMLYAGESFLTGSTIFSVYSSIEAVHRTQHGLFEASVSKHAFSCVYDLRDSSGIMQIVLHQENRQAQTTLPYSDFTFK